MRATFVIGDSVNLIDDHGLHLVQNGTTLFRSEQYVKRLRRGDQDVRRTLQHQAAVGGKGIAGADGTANLRHQQAALASQLHDLAQRNLEVAVNVIAQRLEWRY